MSTLRLTLVAALVASVLAIPATAGTRNAILPDMLKFCEADPSGCGEFLEATIAEMIKTDTDLGGLASFTTTMLSRVTEAMVTSTCWNTRSCAVESVAISAVASIGLIKYAARAKNVYGVAAKADVAAAKTVLVAARAMQEVARNPGRGLRSRYKELLIPNAIADLARKAASFMSPTAATKMKLVAELADTPFTSISSISSVTEVILALSATSAAVEAGAKSPDNEPEKKVTQPDSP